MQTEILKIQGMSCDACVGHVTNALRELDGVQSAVVTLASSQAVVTFDPAKVQISRMREAVEEEGYEAAI